MFLFKKILAPCFFPLPLSLELLLLGLVLLWFTRRQTAGKILVSAGTILLLLFSYDYFPNLVLRPLEGMYPPVSDSLRGQTPVATPTQSPTIKWVVVLGGGEGFSRVLEGVRLYKAEVGRKLILSGGSGFGYTPESQFMEEMARFMGVDRRDIIQESTSRDTEEEAVLIKPLVGKDNFFLVTAASHMPRSMALFHKQGLQPVAAPAKYLIYDPFLPRDFFPNSRALSNLEAAWHEYLGLAWAWWRGVI